MQVSLNPELTAQDLPAHFYVARIYPELSTAYCAEKASDITDAGEIYAIKFDELGEQIKSIQKVSWYTAIMPSRMAGQEYTDIDNVILAKFPERLFPILQTYQRSCIKLLESILADEDKTGEEIPNPSRPEIDAAIAEIKQKFKLD